MGENIFYPIVPTKCIHQLTANNVPRGCDPDDLIRPCGSDCPERKKKKMKKSDRRNGS